jgi:hypothetical protein
VCEQYPETAGYDLLRAGCIRGVGYELGEFLTVELQSSDPTAVNERRDRCTVFEPQYHRPCVDRFYDMLRAKFGPEQWLAAADRYCDPAYRFYQHCIDRMFQDATPAQMGPYAGKVVKHPLPWHPPGTLDDQTTTGVG